MPTKAEKAKSTRQINKMFAFELKNGYTWFWGDRLDLRNAVDVPPEQVKIVLSRVVSKLPKLNVPSNK